MKPSVGRVILVAAGGVVGTAVRLLLGVMIPDLAGLPVATLTANVIGSLLLGVLAARLPGTSGTRLFLGTGILGGFTTYSAFALGTAELWRDSPPLAGAYAVGSIVLGIAVASLGLRLGQRKGRP